jgi:hypothetical protein
VLVKLCSTRNARDARALNESSRRAACACAAMRAWAIWPVSRSVGVGSVDGLRVGGADGTSTVCEGSS